MNEQSVTGMACLQRGAYAECSPVSGTGKKQYRYFACIMAVFLLLIGSLFSSPLCAAVTDAQKAAIASGVATGTDIADIIKNAVESGMTTEQAVEAIIIAGSDPGRVVYQAIVAKYPSESVIKGAAAAVNKQYCTETTQDSCLSKVCAIVAAAIQAGETEAQFRSWMASAGISSIVLANADAQTCQGLSGAPVEGYSAPAAGGALTSIIGWGGGHIGGSRFGSPNQPASKHKP
jgi:hypothetical protein